MKVAFITRQISKGAGNLLPIFRVMPEDVEWKLFDSGSDIGTVLLPYRKRELKKFDVIHLNTTLWGAFVKRLGKPVVCSVHTLQKTEAKFDSSIINKIGVKFEKKTIKNVDFFFTVSDWINEELRNTYGIDSSKVVTVRHAVVDSSIIIEKPVKLGHIMASGRLVKRKNFRLFLECAEACPKTNFVLIGEGKEASSLYREAETVSNLNIYPYSTRDSYARLLNSAFAYVSTSLYEGYPTTVFEAMTAGTPVLAYPIPATAEMIRNRVTGLFFSNPEEFVEKLSILNNTHCLYSSITENAREYVASQPSAAEIAKKFVKVYEELLC